MTEVYLYISVFYYQSWDSLKDKTGFNPKC
nr:MAG TPA: hypothetical protein [Caudoviricetes sp.]DAX78755.1 MAG TPA: hypothetical protein [Caudoviricetes sp.]